VLHGPTSVSQGRTIEDRMVEIRTERLRLRPASLATAYWSTPPHADLRQTRAWLQAMIDIPRGIGEDFAVEYAGRVIGKAGLYRFPEIGFIFRPDCWGKGLAAEAIRVVLDRAFAVHGLDRVDADVDPRNDASLRLLGRLGFIETDRKERTWFVGGRWCDSVYLKLDRRDWRS
jgi:RimJ/RimL family protein N-acetyltransferase